ncbi:MAG: hypothetical protein ACRENH_05840, partial [Gemmatimonadaceae bacterium]
MVSMNRSRAIAGAIVLALACGRRPVETAPAAGSGDAAVVAHPATSAWADSVFRSLSLRDKVAQLVWPWILGDYVAESSTEWQ